MSKRSVRFVESITPVKLYLEDIEELVACLQEVSADAEFTLATAGHAFVTVEELSGLGQHEISELEIRCVSGPRPLHAFLLSIDPGSVTLCRVGDTPVDRHVFAEVEGLLLLRRRWRWRDRLLTWAGVVGPLSAFVLMLAMSSVWPWLFYVGAALGGLSLATFALYRMTDRWSRSRVLLVRREAHRAHWGDVAAALVIVALLAAMAAVTILLAYLARVLFSPTT